MGKCRRCGEEMGPGEWIENHECPLALPASPIPDPAGGMPEEPLGFTGEIRGIERMGEEGNWTLSLKALRYLLALRAVRKGKR